MESKLDYVKELNADAVLVSSVYESHDTSLATNQNTADYGYDVMNHTAVSEKYGGLEAIDSFIKSAHEKGISKHLVVKNFFVVVFIMCTLVLNKLK